MIQIKSVELKAYAKINLTLDILSKRPDGYHELETIMQTVGLFDEIRLTKSNELNELSVVCSDGELCGKSNLAYKSAEVFFAHTGINPKVKIEIKKNIPKAAGLGGGSSDAAAVLNGLNKLYDTDKSKETLCNLGLTLGADVPFCIVGGTKLCKGIGEKIESLPSLCDCYIAIVRDFEKISTKLLYSKFDKTGYEKKPSTKRMIESLSERNLKGISDNLCNVFEKSVPECEKVKEIFLKNGALGSSLSGSGSSVYAIFDDIKKAENCRNLFNSEVYIVKPL